MTLRIKVSTLLTHNYLVTGVIYVVNLKVASSTISTLMLEGKLGDGKHNVINLCARLNRRNGTLQRIEESVCGGPCKHAFTCSGGTGPFTGRTAQMVTTDLPDEILDDYLVFSFVRDPFTRAEASFHQAAYNAHHYFAEHLRGKQGSTNGECDRCPTMIKQMDKRDLG